MPPRRSSHLKHVPLQHASVMESMEAKLNRLRPSPLRKGAQHLQPQPVDPMVHRLTARVLLNHQCPVRLPGPTLQRYATSGEDQPPRQSHPSIRLGRVRWWRNSSGTASRSPATPPPHRCAVLGTVSTMKHSTPLHQSLRFYRLLSGASSSSVPSSSVGVQVIRKLCLGDQG